MEHKKSVRQTDQGSFCVPHIVAIEYMSTQNSQLLAERSPSAQKQKQPGGKKNGAVV